MRSMLLSLRPVILGNWSDACPTRASAAPAGSVVRANHTGTGAFTSATAVQFKGSGKATLLGASTNLGDIVITSSDASCSGGLANINVETLIAADGDVLVLTMHDAACPVSPNVCNRTGHSEVTHGTGRFVGATGQGTMEGHADFNRGTFIHIIVGTIVLANQNNQ